MFERLHGYYRRRQTFFLVLLLFVTFRLLAIWLMRPGGFITDASDYDFYAEWGSLAARGYRTFDNLWTAYPPLFPALMLPIFELSSRIPAWIEPRLAFHLLFGTVLLLFETGNLFLINRLAGRLAAAEQTTLPGKNSSTADAAPPLDPVIFYALLFVPVHTLLGWFEAMPLFFLLLALDQLLSKRRSGWVISALVVALGFLTKLTPIVLAPVAVRWLGARLSLDAMHREWFAPRSPGSLLRPGLYVLLCVASIAGLGYALVGGQLALAFTSFRINAIRPPWQSVWAVLDGFYGYGLVPLDMRNLVGLQRMLWESHLPWGWIGLGFGLLYVWLYTRRYEWTQPRTPIAFTALSVILLFLYSKGWSPQFLVWVLAFVVILMPTGRGVMLAIALSVLNLIESYIYLIILPTQHWIMVGTVVLRTLLLILLAAEFATQIWPRSPNGSLAATRRLLAAATWISLALVLVAVAVGAPRGAQAYAERRFAENPCHDAISYLRQEAESPNRLIATLEMDVWRDFYPWLRQAYTIRVIDGYNPEDRPAGEVQAERLRALTDGHEFWWVTLNADSLEPQSYFADPTVSLFEQQRLGACTVQRVLRLSQPVAQLSAAVPGGQIQLLHHELSALQVGAPLQLVLYWQAEGAVTESYTVFTQLFDPAGRLVAQQDNLPVAGLAPTNTWSSGRLIRDPYTLLIPQGAEPGLYRLLVGLYDSSGRQQLTLADGSTSDALTLKIDLTGR